MKKNSCALRVVLLVLVFFIFKWNCMNRLPSMETVVGDCDSARPMSVQENADCIPENLEWRDRRRYRGHVLPNELIYPPWTREKAYVAQLEPWWGRPFNSASFWAGRPVWLDDESVGLAHRHGRAYPPVPVQYSTFEPSRLLSSGSSSFIWYEDPRMFYTEEEQRFWADFPRHHPHPPEEIERWLQRWSWSLLQAEKNIPSLSSGKEPGSRIRSIKNKPCDIAEFAKNEAESVSLPVEAATEFALYWEYVRWKRVEYGREVENSRRTGFGSGLGFFLRHLDCPAELVQNPPSDEEIRVTTGWRVAYLRRLRREGTDESYIEAYKKAWSLSEDDLREEEE